MERIEFDPEIDPSIREEREAAERESELSARIRVEIERYVEENDLVPRDKADTPPPWDEGSPPRADEIETVHFSPHHDATEDGARREQSDDSAGRAERERKQAEREARRAQKAERAKGHRKAIGSVFTGSILSNERIRAMWPYLLALSVVLVAYIAHTFQLQKMNLERQALEREIRELGIESLERTAERVRATSRSAIVERLGEKQIPLEEFPHPVKTIER
ncbi:MAG: hypothetical protein LBV18_01230 [Alistipes sp.]|jgi:hypothetical protein|nr:hypothetical protein [Alistipes sp.]